MISLLLYIYITAYYTISHISSLFVWSFCDATVLVLCYAKPSQGLVTSCTNH